ncbi:MAG TPA: biotin--[acetyl-CoA-carboxylase] ligase [Thermoplasmata archaeon]|nr:biotin--[acetyl-CoA-carboxylase] ligase [Thermoplasmata archaeon]HEV2428646.1 biotin--[acetyl-CoA-carboxylase] ligase [Thermoplasmata archaeon]
MPERIHRERSGSTQSEALLAARGGAPIGTTFVADRQEEGRGRLDHVWASPPGGLYLSRIASDPREGSGLVPIAIATRLSESLDQTYGVRPLVKWPNDLLVTDPGGRPRKLAGILVDRVSSRSNEPVLVVGVGVNGTTRRTELPAALRDRTAILAELTIRSVDLAELEELAVAAIDGAVEALATGEGREEIVGRARSILYGIGRRARIDGRPAGIVRDLSGDGALSLERDGELLEVRSGEVVVEEAA